MKGAKIVGGLFGALLLLIGAWQVGNVIQHHTGTKNCTMQAEGLVCDTYWK